MRKRLLTIGFAAAALAIGFTAPAAAQDPQRESKRFDLNLQDADLVSATQMLSAESGLDLQFVFKPSSTDYARITLSLKGVTAEEAIRYICDAAGAVCKRDSSGVYIIGPKGSQPEEIKPPEGSPEVRVKAEKIISKIFLKHYNPREMLELLYAQEADRLGEWRALQRFRDMNTAAFIGKGPLNQVLINTPNFPSATPGQPPASSNPANPTIGGAGNDIVVPGGANQGITPGGGRGQVGGGGIGGGGFGGGFGGQTGGAGGQVGQLTPGEGFVPEGIDQIVYDPTDNSLIVRGTDSAVQELEKIISRFDVAPEQVTIKVEFITTSSSNTTNFGIDWLFQRGLVFIGNTPGTQARAGDPFFVNFATGNLTTRLRALLLEGYGTVVNAPMLRTLNNQPAFVLQSIQTFLILNTVVSPGGGGNVITAPQLFPITVQTGLSVQPRINRDRTITMTIQPQVSEFGEIRRGPNGEEIPDVLAQAVAITARIKDGETIVVGGLTRKQESFSVQRFPILSDLPFIGNLFRSTSKKLNNQELLVFITATIVKEDTGGFGP